MAAATRYKKFLLLCERWPLDKAKTDRDLGLHLRQRVAAAFQQGDATKVPDEAACDRTYAALQRIVSDEARTMYPRRKDSTATGKSYEDCHDVTSTLGQQAISEQSMTMMAKWRRSFQQNKKD